MYQTTYVRPGTVAEARRFLLDNPDATLVSGGQTLVPTLRQRLARPSHVVDIARLAELHEITDLAGTVVIGAATTHAEVAASDVVRAKLPGLADLAGTIGDPPVRHRGTIGGSIANNDPAADYPAGVLALDATVETNKRRIAAADFFTGVFETALEADEIVLRVRFPAPRKSAYDTPALKDYTTKYPQALVARDQLQYAQNELGTHDMVEVQKLLSDAIQAGVTGQANPQDALNQAQKNADQILGQYQS